MNKKVVHPNAEETATAQSDSQSVLSGPALGGDKIGVSVAVTAITAGSLDVTVEWSPDGTNFGPADATPDALASFATAVTASKSFDVKAPYYRLVYTIVTGPCTFTATIVN
jgi:hypothetical protein